MLSPHISSSPAALDSPRLQINAVSRRRLFALAGTGTLALVLAACSPQEEPAYTAYTQRDDEQSQFTDAHQSLADELEQIRTSLENAELSLAVYNYSDKQTFLFNPDYRGFEASIVKIPLALTAMRCAFADGKVLDEKHRNYVRSSIGISDNNATIAVFASLGESDEERAQQINETYKKLGITNTTADAGWGSNLTCVEDHAKICRAVYEGVDWIAMDDMQILREAMQAKDPGSQGWGVGTLAKLNGAGAHPADVDAATHVLCKNGWLPDDTQRWNVNSDGVFMAKDKTFALSVMTKGSTNQEEERKLTSRAVEAVVKHLAH